MELIDRRLIDQALGDMLTPTQLAAFRAYRDQRRAVEEEHGGIFAELWTEAQLFLRARGRVRLPPTGWDFASCVIGLSHGVRPEFDPQQRSQWRAFWDWYLPMENHLTRLIGIIRTLHAYKPAHEKLRCELCGVAQVMLDQYQQWLRGGRILWLPLDRGGDPERNIVERLGKVLIDCDTGPLDEGAPDSQWEPHP